MSVTNIISLSELEGAKRLDAEYYQPEYTELEKVINKLAVSKVSALTHFAKKGIFDLSPTLYTRKGIPFIRVQNIRKGFLSEDNLVFISASTHKAEIKTELESHDIVLSKIGTIGEVSIIPPKFPKVNYSQNVIGIKIDKKKIPPGYMLIFLITGYGQFQLQRVQMPQVQSKLELDPIRNLKIVRLGYLEKEIHERVLEIEELLELSKSFYSQAENLFLEELGLKDFKPRYELSYTANLYKAFGVHRVDAEYFQPVFDRIEQYLINKFSAKPIGKINLIQVTTGQYTDEYVGKTEGQPYIRGTDLSNGTVDIDGLLYIAPENQIESKKAKEGDVIVTRVGTIGLSARIPKECENGTISDNLIRLRFDQKELNSYYVALFLGSLIGVALMIRSSRGSVQQRLNQETLKEVLLPIFPNKIQQKIASFVQQSHETRRKAKELLNQAKRKVEQAIENELK